MPPDPELIFEHATDKIYVDEAIQNFKEYSHCKCLEGIKLMEAEMHMKQYLYMSEMLGKYYPAVVDILLEEVRCRRLAVEFMQEANECYNRAHKVLLNCENKFEIVHLLPKRNSDYRLKVINAANGSHGITKCAYLEEWEADKIWLERLNFKDLKDLMLEANQHDMSEADFDHLCQHKRVWP